MIRSVSGFIAGCLITLTAVWILIENDVDTLLVQPDATLPDNTRYYGDVADGKLHGHGRLFSPDDFRYEGGFADGRFSGDGEIEYGNGDSYKGEFVNGYASGKGVFRSASGESYAGEFALDRFNGQGIFTTPENETYAGEFIKGYLTGAGSYSDGKGNQYTGGFLNWKFHGQGRFENNRGDVYEGDLLHGEFTGSGIFTDADKNIFQGEFKNWYLSGQGRYTTANGDEYSGDFEQGVLNGTGAFRGKNGVVYKGEFDNWLYHGKGILAEEDGSTYSGRFEYGYKHGPGVITYSRPVDGVQEKKGEWLYGSFVDPERNQRDKELRENVENAIYHQSYLLDDYLAALQPGKSGEIELYFLGLAASGAQDVFLKEVKFIKTSFDERFEMSGRSLLLANNSSTLPEFPLATKTGLTAALKTIADKMNIDEDILFLYVTSHGLETHEISLHHPGFELPAISAGELGDMVRETGIKWKVIAISACYSGGFIPELKDDNTLIMTAADKDRTSFGCSNDSDMTYFGKAYFKETLPETRSFVQAFAKAKLLIEEWEADDMEKNPAVKHSDPQIFVGKNIEAHLKQWWPAG
jgi:hypothetical protein